LVIRRHPEVYDPAEDTVLLAENLEVDRNDTVLELGVGSGYVSLRAAQKAKFVVGIDINVHAVRLAKCNAKLNNIGNIDFVLGDLFGPIGKSFSLILINPPYLPDTGNIERRPIDLSWNGGIDGRSVIDRFLEDVDRYLQPTGRLLMVQSSASGYDKTMERFAALGFKVRKVAEKRFFFEKICVLEATVTG
jgi:release factor glutamine methyltransferase